jgi:hypothetical protein
LNEADVAYLKALSRHSSEKNLRKSQNISIRTMWKAFFPNIRIDF